MHQYSNSKSLSGEKLFIVKFVKVNVCLSKWLGQLAPSVSALQIVNYKLPHCFDFDKQVQTGKGLQVALLGDFRIWLWDSYPLFYLVVWFCDDR